ncbi:MAG TPA: PAS domain S-box protein, partial [Candidatus Thermoplasmatota archaeon]
MSANLALLALYVLIAAIPGFEDVTTFVGAGFLILGCLFVSHEAWKSSHRHNSMARGWFFIALTYLASAVGWIIASVLVAVQGRIPPSPHWIELVFLSAYVFGMLAILYFGGDSARKGTSWSRILDGVIVTSGLGIAIWTLFFSRLLDLPGLTLAQRIGGLVFPAADLILLTAVILLISRDRHRVNASLAYVCGAILLIVCADLTSWYVTVLEPTASQAAIPAFFLGSTLLMMLGARAARRANTPPTQPGSDGRRLVFVPYVPVALAFAIALPHVATTRTVDAVTLAVGVLMVAAVLVRQYIALSDNQRLVRDANHALQAAAVHGNDARQRELQHRQVLDALDDVVCIVRRDGRVNWASGAFERICGVPSDEAVGRRITDFIEPLSPGDGPMRLDVPFQREAIAKTFAGKRLHVEITVLDAEPPAAGPGGRILILRDVTDRKRVETEHANAIRQQGELDRLEEMNRFKSSF